eukprot:366007-Chlamydomonas_euryale.AAC.5
MRAPCLCTMRAPAPQTVHASIQCDKIVPGLAQLHNCTIAQLHNCTVAQLHNCAAQAGMGVHEVSWTCMASNGLAGACMDVHGLERTRTGLHGLA